MEMLKALIVTPLILMLVALLGYFMGCILSITPLIKDLLASDQVNVPSIMAWLFVASTTFAFFAPKIGDRK
jgi:small-conductance mechanosensitive channel